MAYTADFVSLWRAYDTVVSDLVFGGFDRIGFKEIRQHPSQYTSKYLFVRTPTPLVTVLLGYLCIVAFGLVAHSLQSQASTTKRRGKKTESFFLRAFVVFHNGFLIALSSYMCLTTIYEAIRNKYRLWGNSWDDNQPGMAWIIYVFYVSKLYEFLDTFIMLVKGNVKQVSFLHVYHHASISVIWWAIAHAAPGGDAWYSAALNSFVHVVMYTYYMVATFVGKDEKAKKRYLWWGRYLTQFQMFQFVTMMVQAAYCWYLSPYPKFLSLLLFVYMQTLLALFGHFYISKYLAARTQKLKRV